MYANATPRYLLRGAIVLGTMLSLVAIPKRAAADIPFEVIETTQGSFAQPTARTEVVRSSTEFQNLWREMGRRDMPPEVDFNRQMVIAYYLGGRSRSGYRLTVDLVTVRGGTMRLQVRESTPGRSCFTGPVATAPSIVITTVRWPRDVEVDLHVEVHECGP
jgi:hypothetical protein